MTADMSTEIYSANSPVIQLVRGSK